MKQLTKWEAVRTDMGTIEVKAKFSKRGSKNGVWMTICDCYATVNANGLENAMIVADLLNAADNG